MDGLITAIIFVVILMVLVIAHELGHFWVAKKAGVRVEEFGVGLPPKLWGRKRGETEYTINLLPIGGFVRMQGETGDGVSVKGDGDGAKEDDSRSFASKSVGWRAAILLAGVTANMLLAMVLFTIVYSVGLPQYGATPVISGVAEDSPAAVAGLQVDQTILSLNGVPFDEVRPSFSEVITEHKGQEVIIRVANPDGTEQDVAVTPRTEIPAGQGALGVTIGAGALYVAEVQQYPIWTAWWEGTKQSVEFAKTIVVSLGSMVGGMVTRGDVPSDVAGPVGIAQIIGQARELGWIPVVFFSAIISVNLAVVNLLPFPALDGGRLVFVAWEAVTRRKVSARVEAITHTIGMVILLGLIALITFSDVSKLIK